jgi:hypothetical protein
MAHNVHAVRKSSQQRTVRQFTNWYHNRWTARDQKGIGTVDKDWKHHGSVQICRSIREGHIIKREGSIENHADQEAQNPHKSREPLLV